MPIYPGGLNPFIPAAEQALQSNFSQNPSRFPLNQYVTVAKTDKPDFYANIHDPDEAARINYTDGRDFLWIDGSDGSDNFVKGNSWVEYHCTRYDQQFTIGDQAAAVASWDIIADYATDATSRLMTWRTQNLHNVLGNSGNYGANTGTATALGGGKWNVGTSTTPYAQLGIQAAIQAIIESTNGTITAADLVMVMNPTVAMGLAASDEYRNYLKSSPFAQGYLENANWSGYPYGLGNYVYGLRTVVDATVKNTAKKGAARAASFVVGNYVWIGARPGALMGSLNTMSGATIGMFEDLSVILEHDNFNKRTKGRVYDNHVPFLRAPAAFLITAPL